MFRRPEVSVFSSGADAFIPRGFRIEIQRDGLGKGSFIKSFEIFLLPVRGGTIAHGQHEAPVRPCEDTLDECPMAYKEMQDIVDNIGPTVDILKVIRPIYNFKAGEED